MNAPRTCRTCGCTDNHACHNDVDGACWWVAPISAAIAR
jgi:hypothetical protein